MSTKTPLEEFVEAAGMRLCPRCKCCTVEREECWSCGGEGVNDHDCGEDSCCCLYPEDNVRCDVCLGAGGFDSCYCDESGKHMAGAPEP
ncbi:MAG: hypothetical protein ACREVS_14680 [Burkholderiales bacterium]